MRGGAGIYYATDNFNEEQFKGTGPPFFQAQTIEGHPGTPTLFMRDMMPSFTNSPNVNPFTFDRVNRTPYLTQWSFGAQKSLWKDYLLEVEYTGSTGQQAAAAAQSQHRAHRSDRHDSPRAERAVPAVRVHPDDLQRRLVELQRPDDEAGEALREGPLLPRLVHLAEEPRSRRDRRVLCALGRVQEVRQGPQHVRRAAPVRRHAGSTSFRSDAAVR